MKTHLKSLYYYSQKVHLLAIGDTGGKAVQEQNQAVFRELKDSAIELEKMVRQLKARKEKEEGVSAENVMAAEKEAVSETLHTLDPLDIDSLQAVLENIQGSLCVLTDWVLDAKKSR